MKYSGHRLIILALNLVITGQTLLAFPQKQSAAALTGLRQDKPATRCLNHEQSSVKNVACVRQGNNLCNAESIALNTRTKKTCAVLSKLTNQIIPINQTPTIGIACSGGGFRASIATLGLLRGLERIGILDTVTYAATVSGSSWTLASWINQNSSLNTLTSYLKTQLRNPISLERLDEKAIMESIFNKFTQGREISLNDLWGRILANTFLGSTNSNGMNVRLSTMAPQASNGNFPLPIFTSILGDTSPNYEWAEFSPFEVGSTSLNTWIPTNAFGKKFNKGLSSDPNAEESLGYCLGLWGSAYAINFHDTVNIIKQELQANAEPMMAECLSLLDNNETLRISPPSVYNFAYQLPGCSLNNKTHLTLVDAGLAINLPFPPLLRRNINVYFVCDASSNATSSTTSELHKVADYAKKQRLPFPTINYETLAKQPVSVWQDASNPAAPIVIHIPNFVNFPTFKQSYTESEFNTLMSGIENAIVNNAQMIYNALSTAVTNKKRCSL